MNVVVATVGLGRFSFPLTAPDVFLERVGICSKSLVNLAQSLDGSVDSTALVAGRFADCVSEVFSRDAVHIDKRCIALRFTINDVDHQLILIRFQPISASARELSPG